MSISIKQDRQGARTPTDLEYKYQFGKTFAEIMGIATDARNTAVEAAELDEKLTQEEIFNRLTNNGEVQAVFRGQDGQLYINAAYIVALAEMFAKDITMTGTFTNTVEAFLEPDDEEIQTITRHIEGKEFITPDRIPLYDFNNSGSITSVDAHLAQEARLGNASLSTWSGAVKTPVTLTINLNNPEKAIRITGTNMWGREVDEYIGVNGVTVRHTGTDDYVVYDSRGKVGATNTFTEGWEYRKWNSGKAECWFTKTVYGNCNTAWGSMYISEYSCGNLPYPIVFTSAPVEIVTVKAGGWSVFVYTVGANTAETTGEYKVARPAVAVSPFNATYSFYVVGYWK